MKRSIISYFGLIGKPVLLLIFVLGFSSCSLDNPGAPMWDLTVAIPLSTERYGLEDLISDSAEIAENGGGIDSLSNGMLRYFFEEFIDTTTIADSLLEFVADDTTRYSMSLGPIFFDSTSTNGRLAIDAILPEFTSDGIYDINSLSITDSTPVTLNPLLNIEEADLVDTTTAVLRLNLKNRTNLDWDILNVIIALNEPGYPSIGNVGLTNVNAQSERYYNFDIDGSIIKKNLIILIDGKGPDQTNVGVVETDGLEFDVWLSPVLCETYRGVISKQEPRLKYTNATFDSEDGWITTAQIIEGEVRICIENWKETEDSIYIKFPAIVDYLDKTDTLLVSLKCDASHGQEPTLIDTLIILRNKQLTLDLPPNYRSPNPDPQKMDITSIMVPLSGGFEPDGNPRIADVQWKDSTNISIMVEQFDFLWVWGSTKNDVIELDDKDIEIDIWKDPENLQTDLTGNVKMADASILIDLSGSTFQIPSKLVIDFTSVNSSLDPSISELHAQFTSYIDPDQDTIIIKKGFDGVDSVDIVDMLNHFPEILEFDGNVFFGRENLFGSPFDPYEIYLLTRDDIIFGTMYLEAPIALAVEHQTMIHANVDSVGKGFESALQSATIVTIVRNTLPFGGEIHILAGSFGSDDGAKQELVWNNRTDHSITNPVIFAAPEVDPATGRAIAALNDTITVEIDSDGIDKLSKDDLWIRQI
ncbi:MAG: hypothetical protein HQ568_01210, partial [Calditrichaeota bacterium]|nr:hypothetical protein [Calditrichota bacterium]